MHQSKKKSDKFFLFGNYYHLFFKLSDVLNFPKQFSSQIFPRKVNTKNNVFF